MGFDWFITYLDQHRDVDPTLSFEFINPEWLTNFVYHKFVWICTILARQSASHPTCVTHSLTNRRRRPMCMMKHSEYHADFPVFFLFLRVESCANWPTALRSQWWNVNNTLTQYANNTNFKLLICHWCFCHAWNSSKNEPIELNEITKCLVQLDL